MKNRRSVFWTGEKWDSISLVTTMRLERRDAIVAPKRITIYCMPYAIHCQVMGSKRDYVTTQRLIEKTVREWNWDDNPCTVRFITDAIGLTRLTISKHLKENSILYSKRRRVKNWSGLEQIQDCWRHGAASSSDRKRHLYPAITEYCIESIRKFDEEDCKGDPFRRHWTFVQVLGIAKYVLKMETPERTLPDADIEYSDYVMREFKHKVLGRLAEMADQDPLSPRETSQDSAFIFEI